MSSTRAFWMAIQLAKTGASAELRASLEDVVAS
jgi:hypothetical protein